MARFARRDGVLFAMNLHFPVNTLRLMRGAPERFQDYLRGVFHAMWVDPRNLNDPAIAASALAAPTMFVGAAMYFGQDRLDFVHEAFG